MISQKVGDTTYYTVSGLYDLTQMREAGGEVLQVEPWKAGVWRLHVRFVWEAKGQCAFRIYYCADEILRSWWVNEREKEQLRHAQAMKEIAAWAPPEEGA